MGGNERSKLWETTRTVTPGLIVATAFTVKCAWGQLRMGPGKAGQQNLLLLPKPLQLYDGCCAVRWAVNSRQVLLFSGRSALDMEKCTAPDSGLKLEMG